MPFTANARGGRSGECFGNALAIRSVRQDCCRGPKQVVRQGLQALEMSMPVEYHGPRQEKTPLNFFSQYMRTTRNVLRDKWVDKQPCDQTNT